MLGGKRFNIVMQIKCFSMIIELSIVCLLYTSDAADD